MCRAVFGHMGGVEWKRRPLSKAVGWEHNGVSDQMTHRYQRVRMLKWGDMLRPHAQPGHAGESRSRSEQDDRLSSVERGDAEVPLVRLDVYVRLLRAVSG